MDGGTAIAPVPPLPPVMRTFVAIAHRVLEWLLVAAVGVLIVPVTLQIVSRYTTLIPSYIWTEELARFCFIWMIMIGAMIGVREGRHFDVDLLPRLPPRLEAAVGLLSALLMLVLALLFVHYGWQFTLFGKDQTSEIAELPMWMIFVAWPLTGLAWVVFLGERMLELARRLRAG